MNSVQTYDKINELVFRFKSNINPQEAALELICLFSPLFKKYIKILKSCIINFSDHEFCSFIGLFIKDEKIRKELKTGNISPRNKEFIYKVVYSIRALLYPLSEEDLNSEFIAIFLKIALRYKEIQKGFCTYLKSSFRYEVAKFVSRFINDPLSSATELNDAISREFKLDKMSIIEELDSHWIYGACSEIFTDLTPLDRLIIKMFYLDKFTDIEIAKITGYHRNWIGIKRRRAVETIRQKLKEMKLLVE